MKKQALYHIVMVSLVLSAGAISGSAQFRTDEPTVNIPFDFNVGERTLPAGSYFISRNFETHNLLIIRRADRGVVVIVYASPLNTTQRQMETRLTFNECRGHRFLWRAQSRSGDFGHELIKPHDERKSARIAEDRNLSLQDKNWC